MDRLTIKNIRLYGHCGVSGEERSVGSMFEIDAEVYYDSIIAAESDNIGFAVDDGEVYNCIEKTFKGMAYKLIESAADDIARAVIGGFNDIQKVTIKLRKRPPIDTPLDYIEIETTRSR